LIKLFPYILFEKYIYILSLEMASPGNQHWVSCIGALSFPIGINISSVLYRPTFVMTLTSNVMYFAFALSIYPIHTAQPDATKQGRRKVLEIGGVDSGGSLVCSSA